MAQDYLRRLLGIKQIEISYAQLRLSFRARILLRRLRRKEIYDLVVTEYSIATVIRNYINSKFYILDTCDLMSIHIQQVCVFKEAF